MLTRLVLKILFKASMPLILLVGALSYGMYMRGGDPAAVLGKVASGAFGSMMSSASNATRDAGGALKSLKPGSGPAAAGGVSEFYTWQDADGVTHYSTTPPVDMAAETVTVDPNSNVIAGVETRQPTANQSVGGADSPTASGTMAGEDDSMPMPGMAGIALPPGTDPQDLVKLLQVMQPQ